METDRIVWEVRTADAVASLDGVERGISFVRILWVVRLSLGIVIRSETFPHDPRLMLLCSDDLGWRLLLWLLVVGWKHGVKGSW